MNGGRKERDRISGEERRKKNAVRDTTSTCRDKEHAY